MKTEKFVMFVVYNLRTKIKYKSAKTSIITILLKRLKGFYFVHFLLVCCTYIYMYILVLIGTHSNAYCFVMGYKMYSSI
jgi:hypothetical protein